MRLNASLLASCPRCVDACEARGVHHFSLFFCQYLFNETMWRLEHSGFAQPIWPIWTNLLGENLGILMIVTPRLKHVSKPTFPKV